MKKGEQFTLPLVRGRRCVCVGGGWISRKVLGNILASIKPRNFVQDVAFEAYFQHSPDTLMQS